MQLYLPESWVGDADRLDRSGVPAEFRRERTKGVAEIASDREPGHPARPLATADEGRELRSFRVEGRNAHARGEHEQQDEPVARRVRGQRDPDARQRDAGREQPHRPAPIGPQPEERLDQGRRSLRREHHSPDGSVREGEAVLQERQQCGQRAVGEVRGEMSAREQRHGPPVDLDPHGVRLVAAGWSARRRANAARSAR